MQVQKFRNKLEQKKGQREQIKSDIQACQKRRQDYEKQKEKHEEAREVLNEIVKQLHKKLKANVSELSSLAMEAVLDEPYKLVLKFVRRRNKMECDIRFELGGSEIMPKFGGGGAMDIAAFSLMVASWSMRKPQLDNVLLLDEPFKFLSEGNQPYVSQMLKEISESLGLQIIIVTHKKRIAENADRVFHVTNTDGVSHVKQLKEVQDG